MKNKLLLFALMLLGLQAMATQCPGVRYYLYDNFEDHTQTATQWTQTNVAGSLQWTAEATGASQYPAAAAEGEHYFAFRGISGKTQGAVTRLVTPVMDMSIGYQPMLIFRRYMAAYTGDIDTLRVYYRTSGTADWTLLKSYNQRVTKWTTDSIILPNVNSTYQVCFEAKDGAGRGIAIDDVEMREAPTCDLPNTFTTDSLTTTSAKLLWIGSLDADSFHVVVSKEAINSIADADPESIIADAWVSNWEYHLEGLTVNTKYYVYVHASCAENEADWGSYTFTTKNLVTLPYTQGFNLPYAAGTVSHVSNWTYGTSITKDDGSMEFMPFVNQNIAESSWKNYSYSQTSCLVFTGARSISTKIPAGEYVYAATPEMDVEDMSTVQVKCWGGAYTYYGGEYESALLLGVMTNPDDIATFTVIDTLKAAGDRTFDEYVVSLENYQGTGKYVAFMSRFPNKDNIFYLDDVEISVRPGIMKAKVKAVKEVQPESFKVQAAASGASSFNVMVVKDTTELTLDATLVPASRIVAQLNNVAMPATINLPADANGQFLQVYVQGVNGSAAGEWSLPYKVLVPTAWHADALPDTVTFDETDTWLIAQQKNFCTSTSTYKYPFSIMTQIMPNGTAPFISTSYGQTKQGISLKKAKRLATDGSLIYEQQDGDYVALPAVDTAKQVAVQFAAKAYSSTAPNASGLRVGVMTDPLDITTFTEVARVSLTNAFQTFQVSFDGYTGNGRYVAIQAVPGTEDYKYSTSSAGYADYYTSYDCLDNIVMFSMQGCVPAMGLTAEVADTAVELSWQGNGAQNFVVTVSKNEAFTDTLTSVAVNAAQLHVGGLKAHTTYYWNVRSLCGEGVVSLNGTFTTQCAINGETLPYQEGFETLTASSTIRQLPACWMGTQIAYSYSGESTSYYPYITSTGAQEGKNCMNFGYPSSAKEMYLALPKMAAPVNTLQIDFFIKGASATYRDSLELGVMTDPADLATFQKVHTIAVNGNVYQEQLYTFENYTGAGEYIALRKASDTHYYYLDNFKVSVASSCQKIMKAQAVDANEHGATIKWTDPNNASQYEVKVMNGATLVQDTIVNTNSCVLFDVSKYAINVAYEAYVRAICAAGDSADWSNVITFRTQCTPLAYAAAAEDFSDADRINCWTLGAETGTNLPTRNANGYLYMYTPKTGDGSYAIMPALAVDSITHYQMTFQAHGGTSATAGHKLSVGVITNTSDFSTATMIKHLDLPLVSATTAATGYGFNEAETYTIRFDEYKGDYNDDYGKNVIFYAKNGEVLSYAYIDNITFEPITDCSEPLDLEADSIGANGAHITWKGDSTAVYELRLMTEKMGTTGAQVAVDTLVTGNGATVEGLEMLKKYYMYARAICSAGDSSRWSNVRYFETACPAAMPLPYVEDFDGYTARTSVPYTEPNCWNAWYNGSEGTASSTYARLYATAKYGSTGNGYYMGSKLATANDYSSTVDAYAVLPALDADLSTVMISFKAKATTTTGTCKLLIGVADYNEPLDSVKNYTVVDSVIISGTTYQDYPPVQLTNYQGTGKHIVLQLTGGINTGAVTLGYIYLDNLKVEAMPSCFTPGNVAAEAKSTTQVQLTWVPQGNENAWDIAYVESGQNIKDATIVVADSTTFVVTGLQPSTNYDFYVRANCGSETSNWSDAIPAQTFCLVELEDAHWDFEDHTEMTPVKYSTSTSYVNYSCWQGDNEVYKTSYTYVPYVYPTAKPTTATAAMYGYRSDFSLRLYTTVANQPAWAVLPEINASLDTLQLRFKATSAYISNRSTLALSKTYASGNYPHSVKVGVMTDPSDMSTFEQLAEYVFPEITAANCSLLVDTFAYWNEYTLPLYGASGKYIAFVSDYNTSANYVYLDDVVVEKESGCAAPSKLKADSITGHTALLKWGSSKQKWNLVVREGTDTVLNTVVIGTPQYKVEGLAAATNYNFDVQAYCDGDVLSDWATAEFTTLCDKYDTASAKWNFKENNYAYIPGYATAVIPQCWLAGQLEKGGTSNTYAPYAVPNTTTYQYSREEETTDRAFRFYNYYSTTATSRYTGSYAILPEFDVDFDSTALHFWYRAAYFYSSTYTSTTLRNRLAANNAAYPKDLVIGVVTDVDDPSTFTPVRTVTYDALVATSSNYTTQFANNDPTGNMYWQEAVIPLKDFKNGRIVLYYTGNATGYMFVDDMDIVSAEFCTAPSALQSTNIKSNAADLSWATISDTVALQVATDEDYTNLLVDALLDTTVYALTDLQPATTYYYRLRSFCAEGDTSEWNMSSFRTLHKIRFHEEFTEVVTYPEDWERYSKLAADAFDAGLGNPVANTTTVNWTRSPSSVGMNAGHMIVDNYGTTAHYWLVSPTIDVPATADSLMLTFDLSMTNGSSHNGGPADLTGDDDIFMVAVSQDAGATWDRSDATIWSNDSTGAYVYNEIPSNFGGKKYMLDFSKYAGKPIKIAFYVESTVKNADNDLHLDNVQLNTYSKQSYEAMLCEYEDYEDANFTIAAEDLKVGVNQFGKYTVSKSDAKADVMTELQLTVNGASRAESTATICEGEVYQQDGFDIQVPVTGDFYLKLTSQVTGCDSISTLHLNVIPRVYSTEQDSVKKGETYNWNGMVIESAGTYYDTLQSAVTGCDSIATLYLTYKTQKDTVSALNGLTVFSMSAMPNPVAAGQTFQVVGDFGSGAAVLRIHTLTGALVEEVRVQPMGRSLPVVAPAVPGAYMVSLKTQDERLFRTKILVK